ncbi:MAG: IclR family transcriptional regulator [Desulfuromusa sp.]|jgi:DNA-binding IclR family transcriptional regulator|nr:IclR family transcriptional regulator [Desulfuromusa sp.]
MGYKLSTTVLKAFQILEYVGANQPVQPSSIVKGLELNRTNVHRLLATLSEIGYVVKTPEGFSLTFKLLKLGRTIPLSKDLRNTAKPYMIDLINRVGENVYLCVRVEDMVFAIDDVKSSHRLTLNPDISYSFPIYSCASGKLFLSELSPSERLKYIETLHLEELGRNTITDKLKLHQQAEESKKAGYATDLFEFSDDILSIAAPIYNFDKKIIATIAISGPGTRLTEADMTAHIPELLATAQELSRCFGSGKNSE